MIKHFTRTVSRVSGVARLLLAALIACAGGCGRRSATEPATFVSSRLAAQPLGSGERALHGALPAGPHQRYPLVVGNSWDYSFRTTYTRVIDGQATPPRVSVITFRDELVGVQRLGTQDYFVMEESHRPSWEPYVWLREDSNGLFVLLPPSYVGTDSHSARGSDAYARALDEVRAAVGGMPATEAHREACQHAAAKLAAKLVLARRCATGSAPAGPIGMTELQRLAYPLFVGARWAESPLAECTVTARERVSVPACTTLAWRVRVTSEWFGDGDRVESWYSAAGLVRYNARIEEDIVDFQGNVLGTLKYEGDQTLTAFHLEDPRSPRWLASAQ